VEYYHVILKMAWRTFNQIERLRLDSSFLNRPFIYKRQNLQSELIKQIKNIKEHPLMSGESAKLRFLNRVDLDKSLWKQVDIKLARKADEWAKDIRL